MTYFNTYMFQLDERLVHRKYIYILKWKYSMATNTQTQISLSSAREIFACTLSLNKLALPKIRVSKKLAPLNKLKKVANQLLSHECKLYFALLYNLTNRKGMDMLLQYVYKGLYFFMAFCRPWPANQAFCTHFYSQVHITRIYAYMNGFLWLLNPFP